MIRKTNNLFNYVSIYSTCLAIQNVVYTDTTISCRIFYGKCCPFRPATYHSSDLALRQLCYRSLAMAGGGGGYVDVGRGRCRHVASVSVNQNCWHSAATERCYKFKLISSAISPAETPESNESFSSSSLMSRVTPAAIFFCLCNCIAADIYRGRHRRNSLGGGGGGKHLRFYSRWIVCM